MLCSLAEKYGVDKCPKVFHSYTPVYDAILNATREDAKLVVEIGIGFPALMVPIVGPSYRPGASLRMWRDYFPNAQIIGCDIRKDVFFQESRISCRLLDQSCRTSLQYFKESIGLADLILDDGSHVPDHMMLTFEMLWGSVRPGGFYIIEDIRGHEIQRFVNLQALFPDCEVAHIHHGKNAWDSFVCFKKLINVP